jgi:hypothetical protein
MLVCQIPSQFASDPFGETAPLLAVMALFAQTELRQIDRKMAVQ